MYPRVHKHTHDFTMEGVHVVRTGQGLWACGTEVPH